MTQRREEWVRHWLDRHRPELRSPIERRLEAAEIELGIAWPEDYKHFFVSLNGRPAPFGLWHPDELVSLNIHLPLFQWFKGLVGIGSEGFTVVAFDYRNARAPAVVSVGLSSSDGSDVTPEADSFGEWLARRSGHSRPE